MQPESKNQRRRRFRQLKKTNRLQAEEIVRLEQLVQLKEAQLTRSFRRYDELYHKKLVELRCESDPNVPRGTIYLIGEKAL